MTATISSPAALPADPETPAGRPDRLPLLLTAAVAALTATPVIESKLQAITLACAVAVPLIGPRVLRDRLLRVVCVLLIIWGAGQLASDVWNGLGPRLSMHLVTALALLCMVPVLVFLGRGDFSRMRCVVAGVAGGMVLETILVENASLASAFDWKFGLNGPMAILALALTDLAWHRGYRLPSVAALGAICVLGVVTDHRHLAGVAAITAIVLLIRNRQRHPKVVSVLAGLTLLLGALSGAFIKGSQAGVLGERSGDQIAQFGGTPQAVLVNVRPEPFQEFYLFTLRPLLGWGSLPQLDSAAYQGSKEFLQRLGVVRVDLDNIWLRLEVPGVSAHSQAMDSLARAGVTAAPFWLLLLGLAMLVGTQAIRFRSSPLVVLWTILVLWDSVFSPLAGLSHLELAGYLALAITSLRHGHRSGATSAD